MTRQPDMKCKLVPLNSDAFYQGCYGDSDKLVEEDKEEILRSSQKLRDDLMEDLL